MGLFSKKSKKSKAVPASKPAPAAQKKDSNTWDKWDWNQQLRGATGNEEKKLDLKDVQLKGEGVQKFADALRENPEEAQAIKMLDMNDNKDLGNAGLAVVVEALTEVLAEGKSALTHFYFRDCGLTDSALDLIAGAGSWISGLEQIEAGWNAVTEYPVALCKLKLVYLTLSHVTGTLRLPAELSLLPDTCKIYLNGSEDVQVARGPNMTGGFVDVPEGSIKTDFTDMSVFLEKLNIAPISSAISEDREAERPGGRPEDREAERPEGRPEGRPEDAGAAAADSASPEEEETRGRLVSADDAVTTSASPIFGLMDIAVVPLVEAVKDMLPEFTSFAYTFGNKDAPAKDWSSAVQRQATRSLQEMKRRFAEEGKTFPLADFGGMTLEEAGAIHMYTVEGPFYHVLNMALRLEDRSRTKCAFKYVRLLASACSRLPHKEVELYRGVRCALTALQPKGSFDNGALVDLWSVTSAAQNLAVIKDFLGQQPSDDRTQLTLKCRYASDIAPFSAIRKETECILLPGAQFEVVQAATLVPRSGELVGEFSQVILQEVEGSFLQNLE